MQTRTAFPPSLKRARIVVIAVYVASLLLPAFAEPPNGAGAVSWWHGYTVLALGWLGMLDLQFAWLGNPLLVAALVKPNRTVSGLLGVVVVLALAWHTLPTDARVETISDFGLGYYLWIAAMVGAAALPWVGERKMRGAVATGEVSAAAENGAADVSNAGTVPIRSIGKPGGWTITATDTQISAIDPQGAIRGIALSALGAVAIETNDQGPFVSDVWWMLFDTRKQLACAFPQDAEGAKAAVDRLLDLPGIDHRKVIDAQTSVQNAMFPIWERATQTDAPRDVAQQREN